MAYTLILLSMLLFGLILAVIGGILLFTQKSKLAGAIVFAVGSLTTLFSILGFLSVVIISRTMG